METTIVYWGYIGIMEEKMETTIVFSLKGGITQSAMYSLCAELALLPVAVAAVSSATPLEWQRMQQAGQDHADFSTSWAMCTLIFGR